MLDHEEIALLPPARALGATKFRVCREEEVQVTVAP